MKNEHKNINILIEIYDLYISSNVNPIKIFSTKGISKVFIKVIFSLSAKIPKAFVPTARKDTGSISPEIISANFNKHKVSDWPIPYKFCVVREFFLSTEKYIKKK